jgi:hypothetical protein
MIGFRKQLPSRELALFQPEGYFDGIPYRFVDDVAIEVVMQGKIVRFNDFDDFLRCRPTPTHTRRTIALLVAHVIVCCISLYFVAQRYSYLGLLGNPDSRAVLAGIINCLPLVGLMGMFVFGRFSFGYGLSFYFLTVLLGYCWIVPSSIYGYDGRLATLSIVVSAVAFSVPAVFWRPDRPRFPEMSPAHFELWLKAILIVSAAVLLAGASYNFKLAKLSEIYRYRDQIQFPRLLGYAIGMTTGAFLPFAFACFVFLKRWGYVALTVVLMFAAFPVTLAKLNLLAPVWLTFLLLLSRRRGTREAIILSLLLPILIGLLGFVLQRSGVPSNALIFGTINFRMIAVPSMAIDIYSDFFSRHVLTYFCQISLIKPFLNHCPYAEPLALVMAKSYNFGALNASLFATEGIASVGPVGAPLVAMTCGCLVALANGASAKLPSRFVLVSSGVVLPAFLNVPMTTMLLSNGAAMLFLLWLLTPRSLPPWAGADLP